MNQEADMNASVEVYQTLLGWNKPYKDGDTHIIPKTSDSHAGGISRYLLDE